MIKTTALVAAAALGLAACGSSSNDNASSSSSSSSSSGSAGGAYGSAKTTASSGSSSSDVDMYDNYFKSKTITGKAGSTVKVTLKNDGSAEHNFTIDSQKQANADVAPGKTATVSVKIPTSGSIQFYCEYHKGLGMTGTVKPA